MRAAGTAAAALLAMGLLSACTSALLTPEDRGRICRVAIQESPESLAFRANPLANPVGGPVIGTGVGLVTMFTPYFFVAPVIAVHGAACGAGSVIHPNAEADFQAIFRSAGRCVLGQALEAALRAPRAGCAPASGGLSAAAPDTVIEIEGIDVESGCAYGDWDYVVSVKWRATRATDRTLLVAAKTQCRERTNREVDAWFADPVQARLEIERVLALTGQRIAAELLAPKKLEPACVLHTLNTGAIEQF
jgi:hypothetical protein